MTGCAAGRTAPSFDMASLVGTRWLLEEPPASTAAALPAARPALQFVATDRVAGSGGCNRFVGKASLTGGTLRVGPLAATRMMCPSPLMQVEQRYFQQLESARNARLDGAFLLLLDAAGAPLVRLARAP